MSAAIRRPSTIQTVRLRPARASRKVGASGAIEAALCALVIRHGWAPGTANLGAVDPAVQAQLPALLQEPCERPFRRVLSTSFGFGGLNAALVLGAPDD